MGRATTQSEVEGFADWGFAMLAVGAAIQGANAILPGRVTQNGSFDDVKAHGAKRLSPCGDATIRVENVRARTERCPASTADAAPEVDLHDRDADWEFDQSRPAREGSGPP
jgi:hypothetical protein